MQTEKWGPHLWETFHFLSFGYPENPTEEDKQEIFNLFKSMLRLLPCELCRRSYKFFFEKLDIKKFYDSRKGVILWVFILHNVVNMKLGKDTYTLAKVIYKYENMRARCGVIGSPEYNKCILNKFEYTMVEAKKYSETIHSKYGDIANVMTTNLLNEWVEMKKNDYNKTIV